MSLADNIVEEAAVRGHEDVLRCVEDGADWDQVRDDEEDDTGTHQLHTVRVESATDVDVAG